MFHENEFDGSFLTKIKKMNYFDLFKNKII